MTDTTKEDTKTSKAGKSRAEIISEYVKRAKKVRAIDASGPLAPHTQGLDDSYQYAWFIDDPQHPSSVNRALQEGYEFAKGADVLGRTKGLVDAMPSVTGAHTVVPDKTSGHHLVLMKLPKDIYEAIKADEERERHKAFLATKKDIQTARSRDGLTFKDSIE